MTRSGPNPAPLQPAGQRIGHASHEWHRGGVCGARDDPDHSPDSGRRPGAPAAVCDVHQERSRRDRGHSGDVVTHFVHQPEQFTDVGSHTGAPGVRREQRSSPLI